MIRLISCIQLTLDKAHLDFFSMPKYFAFNFQYVAFMFENKSKFPSFCLVSLFGSEDTFQKAEYKQKSCSAGLIQKNAVFRKDLSHTLSLVAFHQLRMPSAAGEFFTLDARTPPASRTLPPGSPQLPLDDHTLLSFKNRFTFY